MMHTRYSLKPVTFRYAKNANGTTHLRSHHSTITHATILVQEGNGSADSILSTLKSSLCWQQYSHYHSQPKIIWSHHTEFHGFLAFPLIDNGWSAVCVKHQLLKKRLPLPAEQWAWVDLTASLHTTQKRKMFIFVGIQAHFLSHPTCSLVTIQTTLSQLMPLVHTNLYYFQNQLSLSGWSSCAMDFSFLLHILCELRNYCHVTICQ